MVLCIRVTKDRIAGVSQQQTETEEKLQQVQKVLKEVETQMGILTSRFNKESRPPTPRTNPMTSLCSALKQNVDQLLVTRNSFIFEITARLKFNQFSAFEKSYEG